MNSATKLLADAVGFSAIDAHSKRERCPAHHKRSSKCYQKDLQVAPLALLLLYDKGCKARCPGVHRTSCSLCAGHRSRLL